MQFTTTSGRACSSADSTVLGSSALMPAIRRVGAKSFSTGSSTGLRTVPQHSKRSAHSMHSRWPSVPVAPTTITRISTVPRSTTPKPASKPSQPLRGVVVGEPGQGVASAQYLDLVLELRDPAPLGVELVTRLRQPCLRALRPGAGRDLPGVAIHDEVALAGSVEAG